MHSVKRVPNSKHNLPTVLTKAEQSRRHHPNCQLWMSNIMANLRYAEPKHALCSCVAKLNLFGISPFLAHISEIKVVFRLPGTSAAQKPLPNCVIEWLVFAKTFPDGFQIPTASKAPGRRSGSAGSCKVIIIPVIHMEQNCSIVGVYIKIFRNTSQTHTNDI